MITNTSPYDSHSKDKWIDITNNLIDKHPLDTKFITDIVLSAWNNIFESSLGKHKLKIGKHIFPAPQVIGALMHELIPAELSASLPNEWRREKYADEKDIVYIPDEQYSIELKTSSNAKRILAIEAMLKKQHQVKKGKMGIT